MYARSTTITGSADSIDSGAAMFRDEVMPAVMRMDGCIGASLMVDRESGRSIATTAWESMDAMRASAEQVKPLRERTAEHMGGTTQVEEWEIGALHREHPTGSGACTRVTWMQLESGSMDRALDVFRSDTLPALDEIDGFCSASLMMDRTTGRVVITASYRDRQALENSRERAMQLRDTGADDIGAGITEVSEFELVVANLRVPETV
ncbi:MAG TPA: hypothetical protein VFX33_16475 [Actinomycetales bacterium]|nr:hypothetical protein [Actinomycetales bacterium]